MGSKDLYLAFKENIERNNLGDKVRLNFTGCHGFCEKGPLMVVFPQEIFYTSVRPQGCGRDPDQSSRKSEPVERLLCQEPVNGEKIVRESEVPFYQRQNRLLIGNNRLINPESIDDYMRIGGYSALPKALFEMTPEQVIAEVRRLVCAEEAAEVSRQGSNGRPAATHTASPLRDYQCRRRRPGRVHGSVRAGRESALGLEGLDHRVPMPSPTE